MMRNVSRQPDSDCSDCIARVVSDEMDEIIYVSDPVSYDLLFLNAAGKKQMGLTDIRGKCYRLLQRRDTPCPFCTNALLTCDAFHVWEHTSPVNHRHYLLRDKLIRWKGRLARLELAVDVTESENISEAARRRLGIERILMECIRMLGSEKHFSQAVHMILSHLGELHEADRAYIFEHIEGEGGAHIFNNTFEWCRKGVAPQKGILQHVACNDIRFWIEGLRQEGCIVLDSVESLRETCPEAYAVIKPQDIESLIAVPLLLDGAVTGFIGVDNPRRNRDDLSLLRSLAYFTTNEQKKRSMERELRWMSCHDALTKLHNRNSYMLTLKSLEASPPRVLGVAFVDLNGLKRINDRHGHGAGDEYIRAVSAVFLRHFRAEDLFRVGGDEFVFLCPNIAKEVFEGKIAALRKEVDEAYPGALSLGCLWRDDALDVMEMVRQADGLMYKEKERFHAHP